MEEAFAYPLAFQPGTSWFYGPGLDWAGCTVERVTGSTLGDFVRERICKPLGIPPDEAQFYPVKGEGGVRDRLVDLNPNDPQGLGKAVLGGRGDMNLRSDGDFGGHGLFMTGPGYLAVLKSLLANDGTLLKEGTVKGMFADHVGDEARDGFRQAMEGPIGIFFRVGTEVWMRTGFGLGGLVMKEDVERWYGQGTLTWGGGMAFAWFVDPKNDLCGLCAVQPSLPEVDVGVVSDLKDTFRHDVYRKYAAWKEEVRG